MRRLFWLVAAVVLVDTMFFAAVAPLLPHYSDELDLSKTGAGILTAAYPAGTFLGALPAGWLAIRWGVKPTLLTGLSILGASRASASRSRSNIVLLDLARFLQGVGGACMWAAGMAWLVSAAPPDRRGELIGAALSAAIVGVLLGPVLGGAATVLSPEAVFSAVSVVAAGLAAWAWSMPAVEPEESPGIQAMLRALGRPAVLLGFWLFTIPALFAGVVEVLVPLRMDDLGSAGTTIGAVFLIAAAVEAVISPIAGRFSDRAGRLAPIRLGLIAATVMAVILPLPGTAFLVGVAVVAAIASLAVFWAPAMALLSDAAEETGLDQALAFSISNLAWAAGHVLGAGGRRNARRRDLRHGSLRPARGRLRRHVDRPHGHRPPPRRGSLRARRLGAVRPGRRAALAVQPQREAVLPPLRRVGGIAGAAEGAPGRAAELVLAAVLPVRRDSARVPARLALGDEPEDPRELDAAAARAAHGLGAERLEAERAARERPDDAVRDEAVAPLEALHRTLGQRAEHAVGRDAELALDGADGRTAVAALDDDLARSRRAAGGGRARVGERGHGCAREQSARDDQPRNMRAAHGIEDPCHQQSPFHRLRGELTGSRRKVALRDTAVAIRPSGRQGRNWVPRSSPSGQRELGSSNQKSYIQAHRRRGCFAISPVWVTGASSRAGRRPP